MSKKPGYWCIEVSGQKSRNDGLSHISTAEMLQQNDRLVPAETQEEVEPTKDSCRYGKFCQPFEIEMKFKEPTEVLGPFNGVFYLFFEQKDED